MDVYFYHLEHQALERMLPEVINGAKGVLERSGDAKAMQALEETVWLLG